MLDVSLVAHRVPLALVLAVLCPFAGCSAGHDVDSENPALLVDDGGTGQGGDGDDDESGGSGGSRASAGSSAVSGTSGGGSSGTSGGGGGGQTAPPATGCNRCSDAMTQNGATLSGCCTSQNVCGVDIGDLGGGGQQMFGGGGQQMFGGGGNNNNNESMCVERDAPGVVTDACPSADLMGVFTVPGCCRRDGTCGLRITMTAPLGCTTTEVANMVLSLSGGGGRQPVRCNEPPD